jgi:predicted SnoaL-like aldol condensation-catalyzing enzyme
MHRLALATFLAMTALSPAWAADGEANKAVYRSLMDQVWNRRDLTAIDRYLAPDFIEHNKNLPPGAAGRKQFVTAVLAAFSNYHAEIEEVVVDGDIVVARVQWTGTQDGPFQGRPPTHRKLRFWTADFFRVADGKLVEHWDVVDSLPRAIALGLVPEPTQGTAAPKAP